LFKPELNIHFTHFTVLGTKAIFGGYINKEPALLNMILAKKSENHSRVFQPNLDLVDVRVNSNELLIPLLVEGRAAKARN